MEIQIDWSGSSGVWGGRVRRLFRNPALRNPASE